MDFSLSSGRQGRQAVKVVVYGVEGIGKSTFAANFPGAVFIDTEGSTKFLDVTRFDPAPSTWGDLLSMCGWAASNMAPGQTLVVDTLDWAEKLCAASICAENGWKSIETPGYGKGYKVLQESFAKLLSALDAVVRAGVNVCCTAHAKLTKFEQPDEAGAYDRWGMKLTDTRSTSVAAMVKEWADCVLFANYETIVETTDSGKAKARGNRRVMYTTHDACWDAKNRWGLPPKLDFDYQAIAPHVPGGATGGDLRSLMGRDGVSEDELRRAVASQMIAPMDTPVDDYAPEIVSRLVAHWGGVVQVVGELRQQQDIPFA